ncbi:hypothetical protein PQX77_006112 [Marasmius sp. AFHP31]|nr:hypothetical protein PQX77_006112 [Marasmius sp. AFHP31]
MSTFFPYSQLFTVTHVVVFPIATFSVMFLAYGFYILLFILCIDVLAKSRHKSMGTAPHSLYLWLTVLLFVAGTVNVVVFTHDTVRQMSLIFEALQTGDDTGFRKYVTVDRISYADVAMYKLSSVILQGVITIIIDLIGKFEDSYKLVSLGDSIRLGYNGAFAGANLLVTVLTGKQHFVGAFKSVLYALLKRQEYGGFPGKQGNASAEALVAFMGGWWLSCAYSSTQFAYLDLTPNCLDLLQSLESGFLYPVSSFVHLALKQSASEIGVPIDLLPTVTLIAGIAPALMIVRCRVFDALQNRTVREAGTLTTLQFNSNAGAATTVQADQTESQAGDVEAQSESSSSAADGSAGGSNAHDEEKGMNARLSNSPRVL